MGWRDNNPACISRQELDGWPGLDGGIEFVERVEDVRPASTPDAPDCGVGRCDAQTYRRAGVSRGDVCGPVVELMADLATDNSGVCQQISITLDFEAVSAFRHP